MTTESSFTAGFKEKRAKPRIKTSKFYSVEIYVQELSTRYQFKLRDISNSGIGIVVRDDSQILPHLHVGSVLDIWYMPPPRIAASELWKTRIEHISKCENGRYKDHHIVGFSILGKQDS